MMTRRNGDDASEITALQLWEWKKKLPRSTETWTEDEKQKTKTELNLKNCLENMVYFVVLQSRIFMKAKKNSLALIICKHVSLIYRPIWSKKWSLLTIKIFRAEMKNFSVRSRSRPFFAWSRSRLRDLRSSGAVAAQKCGGSATLQRELNIANFSWTH